MKKDKVFLGNQKRASDFEFNAEVAEVFDDMLERSVPFYLEQQKMVVDIGKRFWVPGTIVYDLGCSTATMLVELCDRLPASARLVGYDNSPPMLERARKKIAENNSQKRVEVRLSDLNGELSDLDLENAGIVTMGWTLQFIRPLSRDTRFFIDFYYDFKRKQGYSETEILRKREALENVLIPYQIAENLDLFRRNGFEMVETFFQWFNFAGFLCVKKRVRS